VCAPGDFRCLIAIRPQQVVEAAQRALARPATPEVKGRSTPDH
jgi:hypothetical protein